jgi:cytoskeleton protein RodZ
MKKTGQLLREARESRGISLQEISVHLKINSRILRALEEGDRSQLPAKTFLRGFVQSYAQFLRLDGNEVLEMFQAEMGTTHPKMITKQVEMAAEQNKTSPSVAAVTPANAANTAAPIEIVGGTNSEAKKDNANSTIVAPNLSVDHQTWSHSMKIGTVIIIFAIGAIIVGVVKTIEKYEKEAQVIEPPPLELQAVPRSDLPPVLTPIPGAISEEIAIGDVPASASPSPSSSPEILAESPTDLPQVAASSIPAPIATPTLGTTTALATATPTVETNIERPQEVIIEALDRVVVDYSIDDKPRATIVLSPEKVHTFRGDKSVSLGFSDGGSINLIYNGKDKGVPGNLGKPLKLKFPEQ